MEQERVLEEELNRLVSEQQKLAAEIEQTKKRRDDLVVAQIKNIGAYEVIHKLLSASKPAQEAQADAPEGNEPLAAPPELADKASANRKGAKKAA